MATPSHDALLLFREAIAAGGKPTPTTSPDADEEVPLSKANHLIFVRPTRVAVPIDTQTRFLSAEGKQVDLRSIYFTWINRDITIPEYNAAAEKLNEEMAGVAAVHSFSFVERLNLVTWLEGAGEETEFIMPLAGGKDAAAGAGGSGAVTKTAPTASRSGRGTLDPRLAQIYDGERRMGDRNSVLRGIKPTDFSHVRKLAGQFVTRKPGHHSSTSAAAGGAPSSSANKPTANNPSLSLNPKPVRRPDPIILLSQSASSLLRMSNAKSFLEGGRYAPPENIVPAPTMLHIQRTIKEMDPSRPIRFILVEDTVNFKPEYWNRVVAVFTTGQAWQFKSYKWPNPTELFKHVQGIYLGWRGEQPPESVRGFGHKVLTVSVEKWRDPGAPGAETSRWRDREVVESIWKAIEGSMRAKGWRRDAAPKEI